MKLKSLLVIGFLVIAGNLFSQDFSDPKYAKWGGTPEERKANILKSNFFSDAYNQKQYDLAAKYLNELLNSAPASSVNLYIRGSIIYKRKIAAAKTPEQIKTYVDSLFLIYDKRNEIFGSHATRGSSYIFSEKAKDAIAYIPNDIERIDKLVDEAFEASKGNKLDLNLIQGYFNFLAGLYQTDAIETSFILNEYDQITTVLDQYVGKTDKENKDRDETKEVLDVLFIQSGAASCENLEIIYKPQFEANPTDKALVLKIARYLTQQECESQFRTTISEAFYAMEPSAAAAISLASSAAQSKDYEKAFKFFEEAISLEEDAAKKTNYALSASGTSLISGNYRQAANYANQAISFDESNGLAYYLLAQAQAQAISSNCKGFDAQTAYWIVTDNLIKARNLSKDDEEQLKNVNNFLGSCAAGYPTTEEVFFRTLTPGTSYDVKCGWISGRSIVRERK